MRSFNFKKIAAVSALGFAAVLGTSSVANAQGRWNDQKQDRKIIKQQQKIIKQQQKIQAQRAKIAPRRMPIQPNRQPEWNNNDRGNDYTSNQNRYRVYRNGSYYNTDNRGAELLRQAVNAGYQQGYQAGRQDRSGRRGGTWTSNGVYRSGTYGYQSYVDRSQYQYYFQQGFQRGYQDGYNSRTQYGYNNGGSMNILGTILNSLLNIQQY
jgi:hypothetical protein